MRRDLSGRPSRVRRRYRCYDTLACGVVVLNAAGAIVAVNSAAEQFLRLSRARVRGQTLTDALGNAGWRMTQDDGTPLDPAACLSRMALRTAHAQRGRVLGLLRPDGEHFWVQVEAQPLLRREGRARRVILSFTDITLHVAALRHQALHDGLTGLPNRHLLHDRLDQAVRAARRASAPLAFGLLDIDRFTEINATFGHPQGDLLLQDVAGRLCATLRAVDTVARLGADEFAVLFVDADATAAIRATQRITSALEAEFALAGHMIQVQASIGLALYPDHGTDTRTLWRRAEVALRAAKHARSSYAVYDPAQDQQSLDRLALISDLRQALVSDGLQLYYQPLVALTSGRVVGVEALVRWPHPRRGFIPPDTFIPLAEQTGLIGPLTGWVMATALAQRRAWQQEGWELGVGVNLSMWNLRDPTLPEMVATQLDRYGTPPAALRLELTESSLMTDVVRALEVLTRLRALGVRLAMDDFGTGYSSLAYLKRLPVHQLKIDRSFVQDMATDEINAAIVSSTIGLGHSLGLDVVAEGVETQTAWDLLGSWGCDEAQGYYLARPLPAAALQEWLRTAPWNAT